MIISKCIFYYFKILICFWVIPFFIFSQFSLYQGYEHTDYENQWPKLKLCITRNHCVYYNFIDWIVTSLVPKRKYGFFQFPINIKSTYKNPNRNIEYCNWQQSCMWFAFVLFTCKFSGFMSFFFNLHQWAVQ